MNTVAKRENNEVLDRPQERSFISPQVNIFETKEGYLLEADLPGVTKDGLEVTLEGNHPDSGWSLNRRKSSLLTCSTGNPKASITAVFSSWTHPLTRPRSMPG